MSSFVRIKQSVKNWCWPGLEVVVYFSSFALKYHPRYDPILSNGELVWTPFENNFLCLVFRNSRWDYTHLFHLIFICWDSSFLITWKDMIQIWWKLCCILTTYWHPDRLLMVACLDFQAIVIDVSLIKDHFVILAFCVCFNFLLHLLGANII